MSTRLAQAQQHIEQKEYAQALEVAQKIVRLGSQLIDANTIIGIAAHELGKPQLSRTAFQRVVNLAPQSADAWANLGRSAGRQDDHPAALQAFSHALRLAPENPELPYNLAFAQASLGQLTQAVATLQNRPLSIKAKALKVNLEVDVTPLHAWASNWQNLPFAEWNIPQSILATLLHLIWAWAYGTPQQADYCFTQLAAMIKKVPPDLETDINVTNSVAYGNMFVKLLPLTPPPPQPELPQIYMLGDSHTLPPTPPNRNLGRHASPAPVTPGHREHPLVIGQPQTHHPPGSHRSSSPNLAAAFHGVVLSGGNRYPLRGRHLRPQP